MNDNRKSSSGYVDPELVELFNALTGPQLMELEADEKAQLLPAAQEVIFRAAGSDDNFDAKEKALALVEDSGELLKTHVGFLSLSIMAVVKTDPELITMDKIRSCGLRGDLCEAVNSLTDRKKNLPSRPSTGMMIFGFVSAILMAAALLLLIFHPGVSAWFNEKASTVIMAILAVVVTVGVLIATGSFIGGAVGFGAFALVTWLLNKLIPMAVFLKVLVIILLGLGALVMSIVGKGEVDGFRDGKDREYDEQVSALRNDIKALRTYVRSLLQKANIAKECDETESLNRYSKTILDGCKAVALYYTFAEEKLNELLRDL